jgi:hypothetical protein
MCSGCFWYSLEMSDVTTAHGSRKPARRSLRGGRRLAGPYNQLRLLIRQRCGLEHTELYPRHVLHTTKGPQDHIVREPQAVGHNQAMLPLSVRNQGHRERLQSIILLATCPSFIGRVPRFNGAFMIHSVAAECRDETNQKVSHGNLEIGILKVIFPG